MANFREAYKGSAQLNESLNQLSRWAYAEAEREAKDKGEQYGAENPVTVQQLLDGTASLAQKGSIFGEAARKAQLDSLTTDVEIEAQNRLAGIKAKAKAGDIDAIGALAEIKDMQDGYSSALAKVDPRASNKFRGSIATAGNSILLDIQEDAAKKELSRKKIMVDTWVNDTVPDMIRSHLDAGDTTDPESGRQITPQMRIAAMKSTLRGALVAIGDDAYARMTMKQFDETVTKAQVNAISQFAVSDEFIQGDPSGALSRVRSGQLGRYSSTYQALPEDKRESVRTNIMQEIGRIHTLSERKEKDNEQARKNEVYNLLSRYWPMPEGKAKAALRAEVVSKGSGLISFDQLKTLLKPEGTGEAKENVSLEIRAIDLVRRGGLTDLAEVARRAPGLQPKQLKRVQDMIYDAGDRQLREGVRTMAGIPDGMVQLNGDQQRRFMALTQKVDQLKADAIARTGSYDSAAILGQLRDAREQVTANKEVDAARKKLQEYADKVGIQSIPENASRADLQNIKKKGWFGSEPVFTPPQVTEIERQLKIIRGD
jgi:hypothetical protein